jgi:hypothetical protein
MPRRSADSPENATNRRSSRRFPLQLAVRYRLIGAETTPKWTASESVNISSTGLLFTTSESVLPGQGIEVFVAWPVALNDQVGLKLGLKGPIVRSAGNLTAMRFEKYEFKTRSADLPAA